MKSYKNSDPIPPIMQGSPPPPEMRPPMIDWDRAPWNRWAFQHVREVVPTRAIRRAVQPSVLGTGTSALNDFTYKGIDGQMTSFAQMLDDTYTDAIYVWKNGRVLHESYHNGMNERSLHLLPKRGPKRDWQHTQDYWREKDEFPQINLDGAEFVYGVAKRAAIAAE